MSEQLYPCITDGCETMRTKDEGGTTFTVCDECWDVLHGPQPIRCLCDWRDQETGELRDYLWPALMDPDCPVHSKITSPEEPAHP